MQKANRTNGIFCFAHPHKSISLNTASKSRIFVISLLVSDSYNFTNLAKQDIIETDIMLSAGRAQQYQMKVKSGRTAGLLKKVDLDLIINEGTGFYQMVRGPDHCHITHFKALDRLTLSQSNGQSAMKSPNWPLISAHNRSIPEAYQWIFRNFGV